MKTLLSILFLVSFASYAQNDTLALGQEVIKYYDDITDRTPNVEVTVKGIETAELLFTLKQDKSRLSFLLGTMYYIMATRYTRQDNGTTGFRHKGYVDIENQRKALKSSKKYYQFYIDNAKVNDDMYRAARSGIIQVNERLKESN